MLLIQEESAWKNKSQFTHLWLGRGGGWQLSCRKEPQTLGFDKRPQDPSISDGWCDPETPSLSKDSKMHRQF